jgi:hypothetical protein
VPLQDSAVPLQGIAVPLQDIAVTLQDYAVPMQDSAVPLQGSAVPLQDSAVPLVTCVHLILDPPTCFTDKSGRRQSKGLVVLLKHVEWSKVRYKFSCCLVHILVCTGLQVQCTLLVSPELHNRRCANA